MVVILTNHCDPYGEEKARPLFLGQPSSPSQRWYCKETAIGRYRMECAHGHRGQVMKLCATHVAQFSRRKMEFCPRCNVPPDDHRCRLTLTEIS